MNHALIAESSPDVAPWQLRDDMFVCVACGQWGDRGFLGTVVPDEDAPYICRDCAEDLVTAYVASSPDLRLIRVQSIEMPLLPPENIAAGDITVAITFTPGAAPALCDVQIAPEPLSARVTEHVLSEAAAFLQIYWRDYAEEWQLDTHKEPTDAAPATP